MLSRPAPIPPFLSRNPEIWELVKPYITPRTYAKHDRVIQHGDSAQHLWFVIDGWLKLTRQTPDGKETILHLGTADDIFGEAALVPHASYPYYAEVISNYATLCAISSATIQQLQEHNSLLSAGLMSLLHGHITQARLTFEHMNTMSATQRLGCFLLRLCQATLQDAVTLEIPVEKHILASYLGMKPETLSRSQQQLKALDIRVEGAVIHIANVEALRHFVCNSCSASGEC